MLKLKYAVASDRGLVRGNNEDSAYAGPHLLALADGMGGHAAGEIASQTMINHLRALDVDPGDNDMLALVGMVAGEANAAIAEGIAEDPARDGMGTTLTAFMFNGRDLAMCHVGDSRGYVLRDDKLVQVTVDDTFVQSLVAEGKLDPEDVSTHPQRSLILKAYTGHPVEPTLEQFPALPGDRLLLCSDGLSDPVTHSTIEETVRVGTPQDASTKLVELALRSGGPDNVTVIVADVVEVTEAEAAAEASVPVTAGALNGEQPEDPRPDTAAGRAAAITRRAQVIDPAPKISDAGTEDIPTIEEPPEKSSSKLAVLIVALVILIGVVAAGWWGYSRIDSTFYVAVNDEEAITVEHGVDYRIFGKDLHSQFQVACLNEAGTLSLKESCENGASFKLDDLSASVRGSVAGLPSGSYDEVQAQMQRLAVQALPVCVNLEVTTGGDRNEPGVNCREVS
ncbi:protein phosphatase [Corynebacterium glutamicum ZL-6]|uniref:PP2C family protein-serine/threonine phosphatase n=1 Tax=Corynebacterium TaxID=1716 RepID=UPI00080749BC|nr:MULTISPECIES: PP2C family serine/threonine-protein phosphatase [Corynebacterium]ANR61067.1 protein phosphatase [[Brevibacterium] flavum ZL-1]ANR64066.1 protein phosphatase [Corynebacterium glutamicum ZL-6]PST77251.1 protein phosphatase [Corynebacterium glutamicum ZL-2]